MNEPDFMSGRRSQHRSIRHESLSAELLEEIGAIYDLIGPFMGTTLEQFEIHFMRDADPQTGMVIWRTIAAAWYLYHERFLEGKIQETEAERRLIVALSMISNGFTDQETLRVSPEVARRLFECYDGLRSV